MCTVVVKAYQSEYLVLVIHFEKMYILLFVPSEDSAQPVHQSSLIIVFAVDNKYWIPQHTTYDSVEK